MRYRGTRKVQLDSDQKVSKVTRYLADRLRERAEKVTVKGSVIIFSGVHGRDVGNKMALFTSGSAGEVEVDRNSNMIRFQLSLNDRIKGGALVAAALNAILLYHTWKDADPHDVTFSVYVSVAGLCFGIFFISMVVISSIIHFNLFLNGCLGDAGSPHAHHN